MADSPPLKVFLCHASEDKPIVRELFERLQADGFAPWLDSEALLPGQDRDLEIQKVMRQSGAVIVCFSSVSVSKEGYVQKEIKYAQDIQKEKPEETIFFIPLQLEECEMPFSLRGIQNYCAICASRIKTSSMPSGKK
ncbi:MAG: toll/interleukin-1 receptor domain-containing protein [Chloroflexota bacterium]